MHFLCISVFAQEKTATSGYDGCGGGGAGGKGGWCIGIYEDFLGRRVKRFSYYFLNYEGGFSPPVFLC